MPGKIEGGRSARPTGGKRGGAVMDMIGQLVLPEDITSRKDSTKLGS